MGPEPRAGGKPDFRWSVSLLNPRWRTRAECGSDRGQLDGQQAAAGRGDGVEDRCGGEHSVAEIAAGSGKGRAAEKADARDRISLGKCVL